MTVTTEILEIQANSTIIEIVDEETILEITEDVTIIETAGVGIQGATGLKGDKGEKGDTGEGVPLGGTAGQILSKVSSTDYDTAWIENYADWTSTVKQPVKNNGVSALTKGTPVYVTGANGANILVGKAGAASEATSSKTLGLLAQDLSAQEQGYVITEGILQGLNTSAANAGDPVWLSPVLGELVYGLANKPYAPNHLVFIGIVVRAHQNQGAIAIKPQNGFELKELHDVSVQTPQNGDSLKFESASGLWKGAQTTYVHTQNAVSNLWTINHNLGMYPQVAITDSGGTNVEGAVDYISVNQLTVSFGFAITGTAYLS